MSDTTSTFGKFCFTTLKYIIFFFTLLLFVSAFFFTTYINDMNTQIMLTKTDAVFSSLLCVVAFLFLLHFMRNHSRTCYKILLPLTLLWYLLGGAILVLFSKTAPSADPMSVYSIAESFAIGDMRAIHPTTSYLSYYPHQIGLVAYYEIILRIWNLLPIDLEGYHLLKIINVFFACIVIFFQNKTLELLFQNKKINATYLLLMLLNLPFLIYTSFVYGEIPSLAFFSIGLWSLLKLFKSVQNTDRDNANKAYWLYSIVSFLCFALCVMLRKNAIILMIAVIISTLFEGLRYHKKRIFLNLILYACIALFTLPAIETYYEHRGGNTLSSGVTPLSFVAMGMQEAPRGEGWYNGFNINTYQETNLSTHLSNEISRNAITQRIRYFRENPDRLWCFYRNKYRSQWCDGTYASLQATVSNLGGRIPFFERLYSGNYDFVFLPFCNQMQNLVYFGSFLFAGMQLRKKERHLFGYLAYLGILGAFGGFLFHMLWEANSRYVFPYALLLYPYAAFGLSEFASYLSKCKKEKVGKN